MSPSKPPPPRPDWDRLYETAAPQGGFLTLAEASAAGYSPPLVAFHIHSGRLVRAGRGILRLTHFPAGDHEDLIVLWLWSNRTGTLSHETALLLHGLSDAFPPAPHLTVPKSWATRRLKVPGQATLHFADLADRDRTWVGPVPVTRPLRTLVDCATDHVEPILISQAVTQGLDRGLFTSQQVRAAAKEAGVRLPTSRRRSRG